MSAQEAHSAGRHRDVVVARGLRVRDIATVTLGTEDHVRIISGDGKPAALSTSPGSRAETRWRS